MNYVLAIDDMPIRYNRLSILLNQKQIMLVYSCRMEEVRQYLESDHLCIGVCLDHDMPFGNGLKFAQTFLSERDIPVAITSLNPAGADDIAAELDHHMTPHLILPCDQKNFSQRVIQFFEQNLRNCSQ